MKRCNDKEDDVSYPTTTSLHKAIMKLPEIPWTWRKSTTYDVLMHLGFRQVTASFLSLHLAQFRHVPGILFSIFQVFGHFVSTQWWVDSECPNFFLARRFSVPPLSTIQKFFKIFSPFSATWAFRVHSMLSGFGVPYFFFGSLFFCNPFRTFSMIFSSIFQLLWHFVSTQWWVDSECPKFFLARRFSVPPPSIFQLLGHFVSAQC